MKVGYTKGDRTLVIFVECGDYDFLCAVPNALMARRQARETINAWLVGLATVPGLPMRFSEIESLLDALEREYGPMQESKRTKFRLF